MHLTRVHLRGFRNHNDTALEFGNRTNVILGDNGQGKTNILEAISYLCLTKSFYASGDTVVLGFGREAFEIHGTLVSDAGIEHDVRVAYVLESKEKAYTQNKRCIEPLSSVIGRFPIVVLSPQHAPITFGPPTERRKLVDLVMSQLSAAYMEDLLEYRRILKQRNKILLDAKINRANPTQLLEPWDRQIVEVGSKLTHRRRTFVVEFQSYLLSSYYHITDDVETPAMKYVPMQEIDGANTEYEIAEVLRQQIVRRRREEIHFGTSLVGPHRDEFAFTINGHDLRKYASQGQHKTFLIALKIAEFFYLNEQRNETPVMLLDDVFSELDERRTKRVLNFVGELSQTFVTSTTPTIFEDTLLLGDHNRKFFVSNGTVVYENV